ncbi:unnamed protein product [Aureobasidium uvarum]|uniref:Zn(2)-C6 fungal-type domain-containing protein n=1 Tax=Aureobasidium uvarum TaxID=2773716 RepID=A0A9N8KB25_9PEZI|nr:unnamed protein product [Aureobasidium uvarum]
MDQTKLSRACQACRTSKVRCRRSDDDRSCARCSKAGRTCVPFEESNKRQKRFDSRPIDAIEARLGVLFDAVQDRDASPSSAAQAFTAEGTTVLDPPLATAVLDSNRITDASYSSPTDCSNAHVETSICGIIDDETASMIFDHFGADMLQHLPLMTIPLGMTVEETRQHSPVLLLAILDAAGDGFYGLDLARKLRILLVKVYSARLLDSSAYSMSLLQAFAISMVWFKDLESLQAGEEMDVFHITHAAANMAIMMGLGKRLRDWSWSTMMPRQTDNLRGATSECQFSTLEVRRMWLACYYICVNTSLASQTPNAMPWNRQMDECDDHSLVGVHYGPPGSL